MWEKVEQVMSTTVPKNIESTMDWLAKKFGFLDHMCCSSYNDQVYTEETENPVDCNLNPVNLPVSWDMNDSSIGVEEQYQELCLSPNRDLPNEIIRSERESHTVFSLRKTSPRWESRRQKYGIDSPDRSMSTATTVTTSSSTTIITSSRANFSDISENSSSESWQHPTNHSSHQRQLKDSIGISERKFLASRRIPTPHEIYCDSNFKKKLKDSNKTSRMYCRSSRSSFDSATEGYACDR